MQDSDVGFVDVHAQPEVAQELGIDLETLRERLHGFTGVGYLLAMRKPIT